MPSKAAPRDLSNVHCVRRTKDKNGEEKIELLVLFDWEDPEWGLSEDIVNDMKELFMMLDTDQDGVLTFIEIKNVFRCLGKRLPDEDITKKVRKYSEDETNLSLEFNEFLKLISAELKEDPTKDGNQILQALSLFDQDGDGKLSEDELRRVMVSIGEFVIPEPEFNQLLQMLEKDENGLIEISLIAKILSPDK
ncbi:calmodulin [Eurytemora carolleeae]|uniref:calmodulin n=1 Tax=Eurytemora carolleeae TaxID=1294199 RepID=UPI000C785A48|nr:calmodulin [Eurytemora carolleeae]|eukprot:XP_023333383.1 calmodulin-like [Eurytemora affinis]